ncbi:MAG TPA: SDR family NAD(P)-dependent oxidoreductase [Thermoanaerobaculia bacterium]|nr:SDR family NAD(P)-dependent oxidoreductase [Thermoanaerobaculia bacterium]
MSAQPLASLVAIVTGGSGAIGRSIMAELREGGATAISLDLVASPDPGVESLVCDVRDDASVAGAVREAEAKHGRLDIAVHAAGIARDGVLWKLPVEQWDQVQTVNLRGAFLVLRHAIPAMRRGGNGGRIVLIGSINGSRGKRGTSAYAASKAGLIGLARSVSREVGSFGITANVIEPGYARTPLTESLDPQVLATALAETQLGELVEPDDVAAAVVFLCGPGGRRITGQILRVDSGQHM